MTDLDAVIAGLTEAQRDALRGVYSWPSPWDQECGEWEMYRLGLRNIHAKRGENVTTPLGHAVRERLMEKELSR